ncbi:TetR/AcrR family transcriptional regulator [Massilia sp. IC2-477]|uniref:TetR/AcrR family transcriptional regulator n=1 Tax=Massilia sp. IC2-477 TaxID=2887198 RepID=UPI001D116159|nr:TetR/AcrR family transcriptional regulator [Massilia sp. IC2-477]MCC2958261.1 TetR/AcrR family transcriptional regulator [Massilia sp. IC2-477]
MHTTPNQQDTASPVEENQPRSRRADAQRNLHSLLDAAMEVFAQSGMDAPVREIAERAGVGVGTLYRHFPQRSDLIVAVLKSQIDACADAAPVLAAEFEPAQALARWMERYVDFIVTKRGLSSALQSDSAAYAALPEYFYGRLRPALASLLQAAVNRQLIRPGYEADELLRAVATLCKANPIEETAATKRMVGLLVDGLRCTPAS